VGILPDARRRAFSTTASDDSDMPSAASHGEIHPNAAAGTALML
jgi:hypothetical protein